MFIDSKRIVLPVAAFIAALSSVCCATNDSSPFPSQVQNTRDTIETLLAPFRKTLLRSVYEAEVSTECQIFLLKFATGAERFEPWAHRLIDASGKGPAGLFQGTLADLGSFDSCIETVLKSDEGEETLRGKYCNIYVKSPHGDYVKHIKNITALSHRRTPKFIDFQNSPSVPGIRVGMCLTTDCDREDLQKLADKMGVLMVANITVGSCTTSLPWPITTRQQLVLILLSVLIALVVLATLTDYLSAARSENGKLSDSLPRRILQCFSCRANGTLLMQVNDDVNSDAYAYRFIHGMRFLSMYGVVFGHAYSIFDFTVISRMVNALHYGDSPMFCIVMAGYLCVDTFLFIGALLLTYNVLKSEQSHTTTTIVAIVRRFIRGTIPALFVMVLIFLAPMFLKGPRIEDYYETYSRQFSFEWYSVLLQYRNLQQYSTRGDPHYGLPSMGQLWYLSVDFQLYVVVAICLALTNRESRMFKMFMCCFTLACMIFTGIYIHGTIFTPFVLPMAENWNVIEETLIGFYYLTTTHAPCYFLGALTMFLINDYKNVKISKLSQTLLWIGSFFCACYAIFGTYPWNSGNNLSEGWKVLFAMTQRPLWALFLTWFTFACATGRGGMITDFLSWNGFVPLSRLSFGVFLVHLPMYVLEAAMARERIFFSHINMISRSFSMSCWAFMMSCGIFALVEAPLGRLEKLFLSSFRSRSGAPPADIENINNKKNLEGFKQPRGKSEAFVNNGFFTSSQQDLSPIRHLSIKL